MTTSSIPAGWESVIGLEIHAQLKTRSKIFSGASTAFGAQPNTQACAVDLGLPGVLPVLNREAVRMAIMFGLAVGAEIAPYSVFARKNYFYPDLPKGYQISQYELPIVGRGYIDVELDDGVLKRIGITRAHLEEDAGKSLHEDFHGFTGVDLNRAGTPLIEIVSEPDMRCAREAVAYMRKIHALVRYLQICDGNMQEGSLRCDANVSVRRIGDVELGTRAEIKNLNSFRFVERAINFEIERQIDLLSDGGQVVQETRLYDPDAHETRSMRSKEDAHDYRYFPDPDLLPVEVSTQYVKNIEASLPELPGAKKERFITDHGLSSYDAEVLTASRELADYFEAVVAAAGIEQVKLCANWIMGELQATLNKESVSIEQSPLSADTLALLIKRIADGTISGKIAKQIFDDVWESGGDVDEIIQSKNLKQVTDSGAIEALVNQVIADNPEQIEQLKAGKTKVLGFLVGQVMKNSKGKANPKQVNEMLRSKIV